MSILKRFTKRNVGAADRVLTLLPVLLISISLGIGKITGVWVFVAALITAALLIRAISARSTVYSLFGLSTAN